MNKREKRLNKGITLIALVITIIVLLILAGVALATLTGENGILKKATDAKINTEVASDEEKIKLAIASAIDNNGKFQLTSLNEELKKQGIAENNITTEANNSKITIKGTNGRNYTVNDNGKLQTTTEEEKKGTPISEVVQVGDYVNYNPTKSDAKGTQNVERSKLTYISPVGTIPTTTDDIITHGNGNSEQTFTATDNIKWQVANIDKQTGVVELISEDAIKTTSNTDFILKGGIGYLYVEEELNEACKIYGYGYGADKNTVTSYEIGGIEDKQTKTMTGSGARSITMDDIIKIGGITESDFSIPMTSLVNVAYGPKLNSMDQEYPGKSSSPHTHFYMNFKGSLSSCKKNSNILFGKGYFIAQRFVASNGYVQGCQATYGVSMCSSSAIDRGERGPSYLFASAYAGSYSTSISSNSNSIRPIVTLKSNVTVEKDAESENTWILK